jgi:hypothetical protein
VYQAEKLYFPTDLHTWASAYAQIWARASNMKYWQEIAKTGAWAGVAVAVRLFSVGLDCPSGVVVGGSAMRRVVCDG